MGLTIHWTLRAKTMPIAKMVGIIRKLHNFAKTLPLEELRPIEVLHERQFEDTIPMHPKSYGSESVIPTESFERDGQYYRINPTSGVGFFANPGPGCESADFGLATYHAYYNDLGLNGRGLKLKTDLSGCRWSSFCKTQYAVSEVHGGSPSNFVKCHTMVIALLDCCNALGILEGVTDESDYWEHRNARSLAKAVGASVEEAKEARLAKVASKYYSRRGVLVPVE